MRLSIRANAMSHISEMRDSISVRSFQYAIVRLETPTGGCYLLIGLAILGNHLGRSFMPDVS
jgi:hypothetical protein